MMGFASLWHLDSELNQKSFPKRPVCQGLHSNKIQQLPSLDNKVHLRSHTQTQSNGQFSWGSMSVPRTPTVFVPSSCVPSLICWTPNV
eukprot:2816124-Amphidinium_carterae.1